MNDGLKNTFIALVTFENNGDILKVLPAECHGACGWMAINAASESQVLDALDKELAQIELKLSGHPSPFNRRDRRLRRSPRDECGRLAGGQGDGLGNDSHVLS
jgi:hypothetical protein